MCCGGGSGNDVNCNKDDDDDDDDFDFQVNIMWTDPKRIGWSENISYRWGLYHRPREGYVRYVISRSSFMI